VTIHLESPGVFFIVDPQGFDCIIHQQLGIGFVTGIDRPSTAFKDYCKSADKNPSLAWA